MEVLDLVYRLAFAHFCCSAHSDWTPACGIMSVALLRHPPMSKHSRHPKLPPAPSSAHITPVPRLALAHDRLRTRRPPSLPLYQRSSPALSPPSLPPPSPPPFPLHDHDRQLRVLDTRSAPARSKHALHTPQKEWRKRLPTRAQRCAERSRRIRT